MGAGSMARQGSPPLVGGPLPTARQLAVSGAGFDSSIANSSKRRFVAIVTGSQIDQILERRERLVTDIEALIATCGTDVVLYDAG